jgi:hypothetical protein
VRKGARGRLVHTWVSHCEIIDEVVGYYVVLCGVYLALAALWYTLLKKVYPNDVTTLHKLLLALPSLKFF